MVDRMEEGLIVLYTGYDGKTRPAIVTSIRRPMEGEDQMVPGTCNLVVFSCDMNDAVNLGHTFVQFNVPHDNGEPPIRHSWRFRKHVGVLPP